MTLSKSKPKSVKRKMPLLKDVGQRIVNVHNIGADSFLDRSHLSSSFSAINGMMSRRKSVTMVSSSGVKQELSHNIFADSGHEPLSENATRTLTLEQGRTSGSESEEVDIDIENDDGDENAILQSRSASPSSVYNKLLQQANVDADSAPHTLQDQDVLEEEEGEPRDLHMVVNDPEDTSNGAVESDDCGTQNSDTALSSSGSSHRVESLTSGAWEEDGELGEDKLLEPPEVKHISKLLFSFGKRRQTELIFFS